MLANTEKRVVEANVSISKMYSSELNDSEKKRAAEYLSSQVIQLYAERREFARENEILKQNNVEL